MQHSQDALAMRFDSLEDWLTWQAGLNAHGIELGLDRVSEVWGRLGAPDFGCPVITVGGTNGKGSCVAMLEAMATAAGFRCGVYTSPHIHHYNERIRIAGACVGDAPLCESFARIDRARGPVALTYFEFGTLAALDLFARAGLDLIVLEVGLGGRLDAVNMIDADVAIVTSIGRDHTAWLGDTPEQIAFEKAGIYRPDRPAIIGQADAPERLREEGLARGSRVLQRGREFDHLPGETGWIWRGPQNERLSLPLPTMRGAFQLDNASAAIMALQSLRERLPVPVAAVRQGLMRARLHGRFEIFGAAPRVIFDVAHNREAARALAGNLRTLACPGRLYAVLGMLSDKEPEALARTLGSCVAHWFISASTDARAMPVEQLAARLQQGGVAAGDLTCCADLDAAFDQAHDHAGTEDCVLVTGSFTTVTALLDRVRE